MRNDKIFGCWVGFSSIPRVSHKVQGKGESPHMVDATKQHRRRGIFGKKGDTCGIILEDNPAGDCFALKDLVQTFSNKLRLCN